MERVYLYKIKCRDFLTWKDNTMTFCDGMNVIIADNGVGKSVFFRAIDVVTNFDKKKPSEINQYIRHGATHSEIRFLFSNKRIYRFIIRPTSIEAVYADNGVCRDTQEVTKQFIKDFSLIVEPSSGFISNMLDDSKKKFLVDTDTKSNAHLLDTLIKDEDIEKIIETTSERYKELSSKERLIKSRIKDLEDELKEFEDINMFDMEEELYFRESIEKDFEKITEVYKQIYNINTKKHSMIDDVFNINSLYSLQLLEDIHSILGYTYSENIFNKDRLKDLEYINNIIEDFKEFEEKSIYNIKSLENLLTYSETFGNIKNEIEYDIHSLIELNEYVHNFSIQEDRENYNFYLLQNINSSVDKFSKLEECNKASVDSLIKIYEISQYFNKEEDINSIKASINEELEKLNGKVIDCPIKGKIIYIDGECKECE